ncbi:cell division protein FtsA [Spirochaetia bacterium]|nr:cell division protein FtsA [Spirochaetia bacterium]
MRKGVVVNIEATLKSVAAAVEAAELMSGRAVDGCWASIGGNNIEGLISRGVVAVNGKSRENREISQKDVERVLEAARAVDFSMDRQILEVIPLAYKVDNQSGIRNPLDMIGVRLESEVHIITCSMTSAQNLVTCVNRAGLHVNGLILQSLAAGRAVLTEEEKELGVVLIDLGGGTTGVLGYSQGTPFLQAGIPAGSSQVTSDISIVKGVSLEAAEKIKVTAGCCWPPLLQDNPEDILVPGSGGRAPLTIPRIQVAQIIQPRIVEIFDMVREKIAPHTEKRVFGGGVVITGGGANLLGIADLAAEFFKMPVRVGSPLSTGGLAADYCNPSFATAVGLVLEGGARENESGDHKKKADIRLPEFNFIRRFFDWIKREFF